MRLESSDTRVSGLRLALKRSGAARFGLAWLLGLALVAILAPFLANSRPLLWRSAEGQWSSPALMHLHWFDGLLLGLLLGAVLFAWRRTLGHLLAWPLLLALCAWIWAQPEALNVPHRYRLMVQAGQGQAVLMAPIPYSPRDYLRDQTVRALAPPDAQHWMGSEENGADVASRMLHASRIALGMGVVATSIALSIGVLIGGCMGFLAGRLDILGMRLVEIFESLPTLFLLLSFIAFFGRDLMLMMVIIGLTSWPGYARYVRAEFLRLRELPFVQAALLGGLPLWRVLWGHMLPNALSPLFVAASFGMASAILAEATLSFLGLGPVDAPSWGQMLNQAVTSARFNWWMAVFPGGAIFLTVLAYNLVGDAWRDALEPDA